jgi:hypothetical protein
MSIVLTKYPKNKTLAIFACSLGDSAMTHITPALTAQITVLVASVIFCVSSKAQLGATHKASDDPTTMRAFAAQSRGASPLSVTTITDDGGTTLREYVTADGQIVAYTWEGPTMPDLHKLLGKRFQTFRAGAAQSVNRHMGRVVHEDFVVESGGQMRSYIGRAWLPEALPAGISIDNLQ